MTRKTLLAVIVSAVVAHQIQAAEPDIATIAAGDLPPGSYRQDLSDGVLRLIEPERYLVQLETPALYPQLEQELRAQQQIQLAPEQVLSSDNWQQLSFSQISAAQARIQNEQQLAKIQIQSRFPKARVTGQFSQLENALTVTLTAPDKQALMQQIAQLPGVKAVYPEQLVRAFLGQSVPKIEAHKVWEMQRDNLPIKGKNIRVAVLDTGVDYTHEALGGCLGTGCKVAGGYDFVAKDNDPMDVHGHGTHVASIIAGQSATITGVAPEASIYAYKVLADNGYGSTFDIISALEKAVDPDGDPQTRDGAQIINMSLGHDGRDANDPMVVAVNNAAKAGALVVVAAGNSGPNLESLGSPAIAAEALTVANTLKIDTVSSDSSRGPGVAGELFKPEIAAPGSNIYAAIPGNKYEYKSGTSMAAPHVAGAAALLLQAEPGLSAADLKRRLVQSTDQLTDTYWDHGSGRLNVLKAVRQTLSADLSMLYLGRVNASDFAIQGTRSFSLQNKSSVAADIALNTQWLPDFINVTFDTPNVKLRSGEKKTFEVSYRVDLTKLPENPPPSGAYQFYVTYGTASESAALPILLEYYFPFRLNLMSPISSVYLFTSKWQSINTKYNLTNLTVVDYKLLQKHINIRSEALSTPAHLLPEETKGRWVSRNNWIFRTDVDVTLTPELSVSDSELKHRLRMNSPTRDGKPFWDAENRLAWESVSLNNGKYNLGSYLRFSFCDPICSGTPPVENYFSDLPATASLRIQQQSISPSWQQLIMNTYRFSSPLQTQDLSVDYSDKDLIQLRKHKNSFFSFGQSSVGSSAFSKNVSLSIWSKTTGLTADEMPNSRITFGKGDDWGDKIGTQQWRLTEDGKIEKYRCKTDSCNPTQIADHHLIYSSDVRELSFDNNLRYLTSPLRTDSTQLQIIPRSKAIDLYFSNNIFNDLWQNDAPAFTQISVSQICDTEQVSLEPLKASFWYEQAGSNFATSLQKPADCKGAAILLNYPLDGRDDKGLLGEVRFAQVKAGLDSPYFVNMATFNRAIRGDTISRIDNKFSVEVVSTVDPIKEFKVFLKTKDGEWKLVYHGYNAGIHQFPLPLRAGEQWLDLRLQVITQSGNQLLNTMPEALRLGASAGGDNDVDSDGILNDADTDNDNDSVPDSSDTMPYNPTETTDSDQDGLGNNADPDDDNDGSPDVSDAFPLDPLETTDTDKDGIGNNADPDDDNDGVADTADAFPLDPKETLDSDKDGIGNNADPDDDNDGVADTADAFPLDPKESVDTDKDGIGNNADPDDDNDGVADTADAFPLDPKETLDTDKDGIGNNADSDDDNDGVADTADAFPLDPKETLDTDKDGIGNNADPDDDNDGVADISDKYPLDATRSSDPVTPDTGSSGSGGGGGAGLGGLLLVLPLLAWRRQRSQIINKAA